MLSLRGIFAIENSRAPRIRSESGITIFTMNDVASGLSNHVLTSRESVLFPLLSFLVTSIMSASPSSSIAPVPIRSSRTRIKSQRALESEFTDRLFSKGKDKAVEADPPPNANTNNATKMKAKGKAPRKRGGKGKKEEYCICRSDGTDGRAMIECGVCSDW